MHISLNLRSFPADPFRKRDVSIPPAFSGAMYLALLSLALLSGLAVARRLVEPSCPGCSAKSWVDTTARLECAKCGWSNLATVVVPIAAEAPKHAA